MDNTRDIIRHQVLTGKRKGQPLNPKIITLLETVLDWEYGCSLDCKHYIPNSFGDYGCEFEKCPFKEKEFENWRVLRQESKLMNDKRRLRRAYATIKNEMPWFPDEKEKKGESK
ncbi:MAG: hypothetical protein IIZ78_13220 [Clostridiales bacterium]|nr:hypothetical protein [Clostridiales bacterium]